MLTTHEASHSTRSVRRAALKKRTNTERPERYFVSLEEAAQTLGLSYFTLRDWGLEGRITTHKFGSKVRISNIELDRIIAEAERPRVA